MVFYYDRYNPSKLWDKILFLAGREIQTAELNELQSIFDNKLKSLNDVFFSDGVSIQGASIGIPDSYPGKLFITEGTVYIEGKISYTKGKEVLGDFTGKGIEWVYVDVSKRIITEFDDATLCDPAVGTYNYKMVGAHRGMIDLNFYSESTKPDLAIKYDFILNGSTLFERSLSPSDKTMAMFGQRIYEINDDFLVSGGNITVQDNATDNTKYDITIGPYLAYLKGKRYCSKISQLATIDKPINTFDKQDITSVITSIGSRSPLTNNIFELNFDYVKEVSVCSYPVRKSIQVLHGVSGGLDLLNITGSIAKVYSISKNSITYVETTDYKVSYDDRGIDWSPFGAEPTVGQYYTVDIAYYKTYTLVNGIYDQTKYIIEYPNSPTNWKVCYIVITDPDYYGGDSSFVINPEYTVYKGRIDAVTLDKNFGIVKIIMGESVVKDPKPNPKVSINDFILFEIKPNTGHYYNAKLYERLDKRVFGSSQEKISKLKKQMDEVQTNLMYTQLNKDALTMSAVGNLCGVFTDQFTNMDTSNIGYTGDNPLFPEPFSAGFDNSSLTAHVDTNKDNKDPLTQNYSQLYYNENVYTIPYTSVLYDSQLLATTFISVQPYAIPRTGAQISVKPNTDIWIDEDIQVTTQSVQARNSISSAVNSLTSQSLLKFSSTVAANSVMANSQGGTTTTTNAGVIAAQVAANVGGQSFGGPTGEVALFTVATNMSIQPFVRQRNITIQGEGWYFPGDPSQYKFLCTIGGINVPNFNSSVSLNSQYGFTATVMIPPGVPCGIVPIKMITDPRFFSAEATYYAKGTLNTETREQRAVQALNPIRLTESPATAPLEIQTQSVTTRKIVQATRTREPGPLPSNMIIDPVSESFKFEEDIFISAIGIFFKAKDLTSPVECKISTTTNGYPTTDYIAQAKLQSSDVLISNDASVETVFNFTHPVYIKKGDEYALMVKSPASSYLVFVAKQGQMELKTQETVFTQPYDGVFFTSSNAATWTAEQDTDMTFKIYRAKFNVGNYELLLKEQTINDSWLSVPAQYFEPTGTDCEIYYTIDSGTTWNEYLFGSKKKIIDSGLATKCQVKFVLSTTSNYLTPVVNDSIGTLYWKYKPIGVYYSNTLDMGESNEFDKVKIKFILIPTDAKFQVSFIASVDGSNWSKYDDSTASVKFNLIDGNIGSYEYEYVIDISDNFNGPNLARYLMLSLKFGDSTYSGNNTQRINNMRVSVYRGR
jgi:hypothetical protein